MSPLEQALASTPSQTNGQHPLEAALALPSPAVTASAPIASAPAISAVPNPSYLGVIGNSLVKGVTGLADMLPNAAVNLANLGIAGYGTARHALNVHYDPPNTIPSDALSGWSDIGHATGLINDAREPQTAGQRVADFTGQVLGGGGINPRAISRAAIENPTLISKVAPIVRDLVSPTVAGVAGGVTREAVNQYVDPNSTAGRAASVILPLAAQIGSGSVLSSRKTGSERAYQGTQSVTPDQWTQADQLARTAADQGTPLSGTEALQQVTGKVPSLQTMQRINEQSPYGSSVIAPMMAQRPAANAALASNVIDSIAPATQFPDTIAGQVSNAANAAITAQRQAGNTAAKPYYALTSNDPSTLIPPTDWNSLVSNDGIASTLAKVQADPFNGLGNAQPGSLTWLDAAQKHLASQAKVADQVGDNFASSQMGKARDQILQTADAAFPDYATARSIIAQNMQNNVVPMQNSQVGKLGASTDFRALAGTLLPENPLDVTPAVISRTADSLNAQDPDAVPNLVSQYLRGTFNEANQNLQGGPNQYGGANFAAKVAGNPMQADNLTAAVGSAGGDTSALDTMLHIFQAQGMRPQPGSMTSFNDAGMGMTGNGNIVSKIPVVGDKLSSMWGGWANRQIADALVPSADSVSNLQDLARTNGSYNPMSQQWLATLLQGANAPQNGLLIPPQNPNTSPTIGQGLLSQ